jgi:hypothetical protein
VACTYRLEMQTSDVRKAGTAGSVFLTIIGDACTIGEATLDGGQRLAGWLVGWEEAVTQRGHTPRSQVKCLAPCLQAPTS